MFGECCICKQLVSYESLCQAAGEMVLTDPAQWFEWVCNSEGQPERVYMGITVADALKSLAEKLPAFKAHCFVKQATAFHQLYTARAPQMCSPANRLLKMH